MRGVLFLIPLSQRVQVPSREELRALFTLKSHCQEVLGPSGLKLASKLGTFDFLANPVGLGARAMLVNARE